MLSWRIEGLGCTLGLLSLFGDFSLPPGQGSLPGFSGWDLFLMESCANVSLICSSGLTLSLCGFGRPSEMNHIFLFYFFQPHVSSAPAKAAQSASVGETPPGQLRSVWCKHTASQCTHASHHKAGRNFCIAPATLGELI